MTNLGDLEARIDEHVSRREIYCPGDPLEHCEGFYGPCENVNAKWERNNTNYEDDADNWNYLCPGCRKASDKYWGEMWEDYYASVF